MTFAEQLKQQRKRLRLSQAEAAELLEVSFEVVSKWERELSEPAKITQEGALTRLAKVMTPTPEMKSFGDRVRKAMGKRPSK